MDKNLLTPKQQAALDFIKTYKGRNAQAPLLSEIKAEMGVSSIRSVTQILEALEQKGLIRRDRFQHRGITLIEHDPTSPHGTVRVPVIASAGCDAVEVFAQERFDEFLSVDTKLVAPGQDIAAVKAVGNSMIDAGINNGDYVLVEVTQHVGDGDRVVAVIGDMAVIKRYQKAGDTVILNPENKDGGYSPIVVQDANAKIFGKVLSVISSGTLPEAEIEIVYEDWYKGPQRRMAKDEMTAMVNRELEAFLPRISGNLQHNMIRMAYNMLRRNDLAKTNPDGAEATLKKAYEYVQGTGT